MPNIGQIPVLGGALPQSFEESVNPTLPGYGVVAPPPEPSKKTSSGLQLAYKKTCASEFSETSGFAYGPKKPGHLIFAELNMGTALGGLKPHQTIAIKYKGKGVIAEKGDIGTGGIGCGGQIRGIDLQTDTARALGFNGKDVVEWAPISGTQLQQVGINPLEVFNPKFNEKVFEEIFGKGSANPATNLTPPGVPNPLGALNFLKGFFKKAGEILNFLGSAAGWVRIGKVLIGVIILLIALIEIGRIGAGSTGRSIPGKAIDVGTRGVI